LPIDVVQGDSRAARALRRARLAQSAYWLLAALAVLALAYGAYVSRLPHEVAVGAKVSRDVPEMPEQQLAKDNTIGGLDTAKLPFTIKTLKGFQDKDDPDLYHLQDVSGIFRRDNGKDLAVQGNGGTYHNQREVLHLEGAVRVAEDPRFEAHMAKAVFDIKQHRLSSDVPVHVKLDNGTIDADSMVAENSGETMNFKGNVKAHFNSANATGEQQQ
jgi:LPS export ABC transporter protein LptC